MREAFCQAALACSSLALTRMFVCMYKLIVPQNELVFSVEAFVPLSTSPKYVGPAVRDVTKMCCCDLFWFLFPRAVYATEPSFGRLVLISHIYTLSCCYQISRENHLPNYRKSSGVWKVFSWTFLRLVLSGRASAAMQGVLSYRLEVMFLQTNQANTWALLMDHVIHSCFKPSDQNDHM